MKKKKAFKRIPIILSVLLLLAVGGWWAFSVHIYNENFNQRFSSYEPLMFHTEDFEGLQAQRYEFPSDKGQMLTGYLYSTAGEPHGIVVLAHGFGGGGQNAYMDCANYFAHSGYDVFAYDATGNDESGGDGVGGIPQGVIDLDHAITFVEESSDFPDLPIVLWGHSWGGYSVCNVLNYHPEVKAVIECAGCNRSSDLFEAGGRKQAGDVIDTMMPFIRLHERIRYGKYAASTAMDGFAASDAAVMIVHSEDDDVVPIRYGYDVYYAQYKDDPRFVFRRLTDRGHNYLFDDTSYINELNADLNRWYEALEYDATAPENAERFAAEKADYLHSHLDRDKWCSCLDTEMFAEFVRFYDAHIG